MSSPCDAHTAAPDTTQPPHLERQPSSAASVRSTASDATITDRDRAPDRRPGLLHAQLHPPHPHHPTHNPHARRQQGTWVPSGTPLAPGGVGAGLAERIQFGGMSYDSLASIGDSSPERRGSRSPSRSVSSSPDSRDRVPKKRRSSNGLGSRSPSRPVGSLRARTGANSNLDSLPDLPPARDLPSYSEAEDETDERAQRTASADDWDNVRDGSIARRSAWRRPSPQWLMPFVLGLTMSLGMTMSPRAELYLDLACLAHPPRMPASDAGLAEAFWASAISTEALDPKEFWTTIPGGHDGNLDLVGGLSGNQTAPHLLSPGEKWFLRAHRDMYPSTPSQPGRPNQPVPLPPVSGNETQTTPGTGTGGNNNGAPYPEIDPALCKKDEKVQAAAARLTMTLTVMAGLLSAMTTGYWASVSDRIGRRPIMAMVQFGLLLNDGCFLFLATFPRFIMQGGIYVLLIGPILDGCLGGFSTMSATLHAYISDVTPDGSRATTFARLGGALMGGFTIGPILGSAMISATGNILFPFYVSVCVHALFSLSLRFILPESLSSESRAALTKRALVAQERAKARRAAERAWEDEGDSILPSISDMREVVGNAAMRVFHPGQWAERRRSQAEAEEDETLNGGADDSSWSRISGAVGRARTTRRTAGNFRRLGKQATGFLKPLLIFKPRVVAGHAHRDWNLTLVGACAFFTSLLMGVIQVKFQYALYAFGWGTSQLGPYMSLISFCRLIVLLGLTPVAMYYLKPFFTERTIIEDASETTPLLDADADDRPAASSSSARSPSETPDSTDKPKPKRSAALDLLVLRAAIAVETVGYTLLGLNAHASVTVFIASSAVVTLGSPTQAACSSLALSFIPHSREAGRLFGGLAVLQALASALISPILFSNLFAVSVGWYAPLVFLLAAGVLVCAQSAIAFIRLHPHSTDEERARGRAKARGKRRAVHQDE